MGKRNKNRSKYTNDSDDEAPAYVPASVPAFVPADNNDDWETPKNTTKKKNLFKLLDNTSDSEHDLSSPKHIAKQVSTPPASPVTPPTPATPATTPITPAISSSTPDYFDIAYKYDEAGDYENAIKNYKLCMNDKVALNNLGVIYWNMETDFDMRTALQTLSYFRKAIELNYRLGLFNFASYVSEHSEELSKFKEEARTYMIRYMLLKNADIDEKRIINNLFTLN